MRTTHVMFSSLKFCSTFVSIYQMRRWMHLKRVHLLLCPDLQLLQNVYPIFFRRSCISKPDRSQVLRSVYWPMIRSKFGGHQLNYGWHRTTSSQETIRGQTGITVLTTGGKHMELVNSKRHGASWSISGFKEGSDAFVANNSLRGYKMKLRFARGKLQAL